MWVQVRHLDQVVKQAKLLVKNDAFIVSAIPTTQEAPDQYKLVRCRDNALLYKSRETMSQMIEDSQIAVWDPHAEQTESIPKTEVSSCSELMPGDCILLGGIESVLVGPASFGTETDGQPGGAPDSFMFLTDYYGKQIVRVFLVVELADLIKSGKVYKKVYSQIGWSES